MNRSILFIGLLIVLPVSLSAWNRVHLINRSTPIGDNWYYDDPFGYFQVLGDPAAPEGWILHNEHAWLWVFDNGSSGSARWLVYDPGMDGAVWEYDVSLYPDAIGRKPADATCYDVVSYLGGSPDRLFMEIHCGGDGQDIPKYWPVTLEYTESGPHGPVPVWWKMYGAVDLTRQSDHFAIATQGQLKHVATIAKEYLDARFSLSQADWNAAYAASGGSNPFPFAPGTASDGRNHRPVTLGQLKFIASGFYRILATHAPNYDALGRYLDLGLQNGQFQAQSPHFPWSATSASGTSGMVANLGQLKLAFSFDIDNGLFAPGGGPPVDAPGSPPAAQTAALMMGRPTSYSWIESSEDPDSWWGYFTLSQPTAHPMFTNHYWSFSAWFGWLVYNSQTLPIAGTDAAWIWHLEHGWIFLNERDLGDGQMMYDFQLGWLWVNRAYTNVPGKMGWFYAYDYNQWMYYISHEVGWSRTFYHDGTDENVIRLVADVEYEDFDNDQLTNRIELHLKSDPNQVTHDRTGSDGPYLLLF